MKVITTSSKLLQIGFLALLLCFATACGDVTSGTGEFGRVVYSLYSHYVVENSNITDISILAGHPQEIRTELTSKGSEDVKTPQELTHEVSPSEGVSVLFQDDGYDVPDMTVTVTEPGAYTLETLDGDSVFDRIQFTFEVPSSLDAIVWIRRSSDSEFQKTSATGTILVDEGTQVTVIPIPVDSDGNRIVGDFESVISATPGDLVVATENILGAYEQSIWATPDPVSLVFIDPGTVEVTIEDAVNKVARVLVFEVADN